MAAMKAVLLTALVVAAEDCGTEQCKAPATCGGWCNDGLEEACIMNASVIPCQGEYCKTTCRRWSRSILAGSVAVTCQEFSDFAVYPRGGRLCKEECLLPEIRKDRYPSPTGLGLFCRPNSCDPAVQVRYNQKALDSGLGALECPCNWFGSDCQDDWVPVQQLEKEVLGDFEVTYLSIDKAAWRRVMKDYRPGSILRVQHLDDEGIPREQPYALAGEDQEGLLEILTGPPPQGLHDVVVEVAHAVRRCATGSCGLFVNPAISGFFNGRYSFLMDSLQSVKQVALVSSGVGLSGIKAAIASLPSSLGIHVFYGIRDVANLPYKRFWRSRLAQKQLNLTLLVSGASSDAGDLQDAVQRGKALLQAASGRKVPEPLRALTSGKIYAQQAVALDFLAGGLAEVGATLADTAVVICGRNELLIETPRLLQATCDLDAASCETLMQAHVFTNI